MKKLYTIITPLSMKNDEQGKPIKHKAGQTIELTEDEAAPFLELKAIKVADASQVQPRFGDEEPEFTPEELEQLRAWKAQKNSPPKIEHPTLPFVSVEKTPDTAPKKTAKKTDESQP